MSGFLLDTNIILLAGFDSERLSENTKNAIEQGPNYLSVVSYWEVVLKSTKGRLNVGDPISWWSEALRQMAATPLLLRPEHITELSSLALIHQDPFDRVLIAQAKIEDCTLLTTDRQISLYTDRKLRVIH